jgi:glutamyl-tRNA synthetase
MDPVERGRFAPSPTGAMHLGNARTALLAWLDIRSRGGRMLLRIEDLDRARIPAGAEQGVLHDLAWLGLDWDEGPYRQSERTDRYDAAIEMLLAAGRAFPCACSRADVAGAARAPHAEDDDGPRYPGTCRDRSGDEVRALAASRGRAPSIRFDGRGERVAFRDEVHGRVEPEGEGVDDFVLRRADGVAAYQLAVVVDDAAMAVTRVVRGDDLLRSTPRQIALYRALGATPPVFAHVPLLLTAGGERLAKRTRPESLASMRDSGTAPEDIVGALAASLGLVAEGTRARAHDLIADFRLERLAR